MGKNTYVAVGNKEDISDIITNITPKKTPFYSACGKGEKATATKHEWLEDQLRKPRLNEKVEGFEFTVEDPTPRKRLDNYTQIVSNGYGVTATQEAVAKHAVKSEIGYQMQKAMKETALDIEYALIMNATRNAGSETVARKMGGVPFFITTNEVAAGGPLLEALLNDALEKAWAEGGNPTKGYLSGTNKRVVSSWSGEGDKYLDQNSKKLVNTISVYESDFGIVSFVPHHMMPDDQVFVIDPDFWKLAYLRNLKTEPLPKTKDGIDKVIVGELTLEARAEKASAKITGITVTATPEP